MLRRLSGRTHQVITGVTLVTAGKKKTFATVSEVTFDELSDEEIAYYVAHYRPLDKAGAYGIQEWIGYVGVSSSAVLISMSWDCRCNVYIRN